MKILVLNGIVYGDGGGFWDRDAGLIVRDLRALGAEAWLVAFGESRQSSDPDRPVITAPRAVLEDPAWWKAQAPDGVLLMLWGASRFEPIRQAARQATRRIIERLDTDGVRSPRVWFWEYLAKTWAFQRDAAMNPVLAPALALGRTLLVRAFPGLLDKKLVSGLSRVPLVVAESPVAVERIRRWSRSLGFTPPPLACITHPVDQECMTFDPAVERQNRIVSVGRWESKQKNLPLMLKVLEDFLELRPDWSAKLIGRLPKDLEPRLKRLAPDIRNRLQFTGQLPHRQLAPIYQSAKIYFLASGHEGFCIAAAEALCCGCSVVGPVDTGGMQFVAGYASGTVACRKTRPHLLDALGAEVAAWEAGWRDPRQSAHTWTQRVSARVVAGQYLKALDQLPG